MPIRNGFRPKVQRARGSNRRTDESLGLAELFSTISELRGLKEKTQEDLNTIVRELQTRGRDMSDDTARALQSLINDTQRKLDDMQHDFDRADRSTDKAVERLERALDSVPDLDKIVKTVLLNIEKPEKGEDGKTPTKKELTALIKPLVPKIETPKQEVIKQTPIDEEKLVKKILRTIKPEIKLPKLPDFNKMISDMVTAQMMKVNEKVETRLRAISSKAMLGAGGGGMGDIKYFKFTCDGATTEFTLPGTPTQEGKAVFAFYQGQRLHFDEHHTVSGTTLTTTFTGDDAQVIDGWIIT